MGFFAVEDQPVNQALRRLIAAVQIDRGQDGLHGVGVDAGPAAATAVFLAMAQHQIAAQVQPGRHRRQTALADQLRPHPREVALGMVGTGPVEILGHDEAQDRVAQEFQPLVAAQVFLPVFVGIGTMPHRVFQQALVPEGVAEGLFQF